ncbi:MAG: hypothetical protein KKF30_12370 [Proteobacteria bacterium]|nr:hypothetical protein [Pseudomonadota bacterium]MBU4469475.1 hypothetical protein [Pseudomonadota bacterium]MCG2752374.1 hypothetical protein [Desulfobacteraceae bacterium]
MPVMESLINKVIALILVNSSKSAYLRLIRKEKVLKILEAVGMKPDKPEANFEATYAYSLIEYGVDRPRVLLEFFSHEEIRKAYQNSFNDNDLSLSG